MPREGSIEVEGLRIRYTEAGEGMPLVLLHRAEGLRLTARDLLSRHFRVIDFEIPASGHPAELAAVTKAIDALRIETFNLMGSSVGSEPALRLALQEPTRVRALVLEAPTVIRPDGGGDVDLERRLPELSAPTLVLFGTVDRVSPPAMGRRYKALMPGCHLVFVYDAGHAISTDRPQAFAEVVVDFLQRHDAFVISRAETVIHP